MLEKTVRKQSLLAATAGVTLALGLAVSAGLLPRAADDVAVRSAAVSDVEVLATSDTREPLGAAPGTGVAGAETLPPAAVTPAAAVTVIPPVAKALVAAVKVPVAAAAKPNSTATVAKAPAAPTTSTRTSTQTTVPAAAAPAAPVAPVAPVVVPRRTPTSAEVEDTIDELQRQIGGLLRFAPPQASQIEEGGDEVCTGFDNGETFAQVKAKGMSEVPSTISVKPATVDWAVRRAVTLYCPGHADKLV